MKGFNCTNEVTYNGRKAKPEKSCKHFNTSKFPEDFKVTIIVNLPESRKSMEKDLIRTKKMSEI